MYSTYNSKIPNSNNNKKQLNKSSSRPNIVKYPLSSIRDRPLSSSFSQRPIPKKKNCNSSIGSNRNLNEEQIEIKIPTPYPQAKFMTIDDPSLQSGEYTVILNEKYPPRKYLKHNAQSFNKTTKNIKSDLKFTFLNPKINFADYNLKSLTYKNEEIDETKITNLPDALEIIDRLKTKLINYELTNNSNIEKANELINKLKEQNEFYVKKLNEIYNNMDIIEKEYGIDINHPNPNDPMNILVKNFRERWLKRNFMNLFKSRIYRQQNIRYLYYNNILVKHNNNLKLKSLIGFEKMQNICEFKKTLGKKREIYKKRQILYDLKQNVILTNLQRKFYDVQKNLYQLLYIKELKLAIYRKKGYSSSNKKALLHYYLKTTGKVIKILKVNAIHNTSNNIRTINKKDQCTNDTPINYLRFTKNLSKKYKNKLTPQIKEQKIKGLQKLKQFHNRIERINNEKMINQKETNKNIILAHYLKLWQKGSDENYKILQFGMNLRNKIIKSFFTQIKKFHKHKYYDMALHNQLIKQINALQFFDKIRYKVKIKKNKNQFTKKLPSIIISSIFSKLYNLSQNDPKIHFNRIRKKVLFSDFFDKSKASIASHNKQIQLLNLKEKFLSLYPNIYYKIVFLILRNKVLLSRIKYLRIKKLLNKHYITKSIRKLLLLSFKKKESKIRLYYENTIASIKKILNEKAGIINKMEYDNNDLAYNYEKTLTQINNMTKENENLRKIICEMKYNFEVEKKRYTELLQQNSNDLQSLQITVKTNQDLLAQAIEREELLQKKYCNDIQNAIKLNKNLNEIITKKNQQILEINKMKSKENEEMMVEKQKLTQQNAMLYCDLSAAIQAKEKEKMLLQQEAIKKINESKNLIEKYEKENSTLSDRLSYQLTKSK